MRARNIKPGFFKNDVLAECGPLARILFAGLWCMADREGRLEYRPKKIKAEILPYDNCNIEKLVDELSARGFVGLYSVNGENYLNIINFAKHQFCHVREQASSLPAPDEHQSSTSQAPEEHRSNPPESPIPHTESPIPHIDNTGKGASTSPKPQQKTKFLDSVLLTDQEYQKLILKYGRDPTERAIEILNNGIMSKGYKYKSHYHTLIGWPMKEARGNGNGNGFARSPGPAVKKTGNAESDGQPYPADREY
jgi:hypothetical protein